MNGAGTDRPFVLVGAKPPDAVPAVRSLGRPVVLVVDPVDGPPPRPVPGMRVMRVPFKSDPAALVHAPLPPDCAGVVSFTELGLFPAAALAETLGLPGVGVGAVLRTRDKLHMRRALDGVLPQPPFGVCGRDRPSDGHFPVVVKPRNGSGSRGVCFAADRAAFDALDRSVEGWLWEGYVDGDEYSVESVTLAGVHHVLGVTRKITTGPPYFVETGHVAPAVLPVPLDVEVRRTTRACLDALGVGTGAAHTELKIRDGEVFVVETHTRAGGDRIPVLTELVSGADQLRLALHGLEHPEASALPDPPPGGGRPTAPVAGIRYFPWQDETVDAVHGLDACRALPGVVEAEVVVGPGDRIPVWRYSHERPGYVLATAADHDELERRLTAAVAAVTMTPRSRAADGAARASERGRAS